MKEHTAEKLVINAKEEKLLKIIKDVGYGEIKVIINEGNPIRIEELKKSIKL
ncbi:hypothetical protein SDC9_148297 [bioreactor metagenome]|uniref:DUF2292 domain-containing protein n=1 Tax=bioreactor metagenome TaxID=1076179 RepID=A0A645EK47_9ZZZZ